MQLIRSGRILTLTDYKVHIKHDPRIKNTDNVYDFVEFKLLKVFENSLETKGKKTQNQLKELIELYVTGQVAVRFNDAGMPEWISVDR